MSENATYTVAGMSCGHCVAAVTRRAAKLDGVTDGRRRAATAAPSPSGSDAAARRRGRAGRRGRGRLRAGRLSRGPAGPPRALRRRRLGVVFAGSFALGTATDGDDEPAVPTTTMVVDHDDHE